MATNYRTYPPTESRASRIWYGWVAPLGLIGAIVAIVWYCAALVAVTK